MKHPRCLRREPLCASSSSLARVMKEPKRLKVEWSDSDGPNNMRYWELPTVLSATIHVAWASVSLAIEVVVSPCFLALLQVLSFSSYSLVNIFSCLIIGLKLKDMQDYDSNQSSVLKSTTRLSA
jgi:hypothetical protein